MQDKPDDVTHEEISEESTPDPIPSLERNIKVPINPEKPEDGMLTIRPVPPMEMMRLDAMSYVGDVLSYNVLATTVTRAAIIDAPDLEDPYSDKKAHCDRMIGLEKEYSRAAKCELVTERYMNALLIHGVGVPLRVHEEVTKMIQPLSKAQRKN